MPSVGPSTEEGASSRSKKNLVADSIAVDGGYRAKRYAVKFQPPCIFLEYEDSLKKRRVRAVKLSGVQVNVDVDRLTKKVIRSFPRKLEASSVKYDQVRKLVVKLMEFLAAAAAAEAAAARASASATASSDSGPSRAGDSNSCDGGHGPPLRISDSGVTNGSVSAPLPALSPRLDPRTPGGRLLPHSGPGAGNGHQNRGSIESTMSRFSTSTGGSSSDSEEDLASALDELSKEMAGVSVASSEVNSRDSSFSFKDRPSSFPGFGPGGAGRPPGGSVLDGGVAGAGGSASTSSSSSAPTAAAGGVVGGPRSRFAVEAEKLTIGIEVTEDLDLNKVTELELKMAKQAMEGDFQRNQLKPGDPGYEYDKQVEFAPVAGNNDWDDSGDEEEEEEVAAGGSEVPEVDWADIQAAVAKPGAGATGSTPGGGSSADDGSPLRGAGGGGSKGGGGGGGGSRPGGEGASPYNSNDWP